jgi:nitrogen regulatory protein PII
MKEVKAFIKRHKLRDVVSALRKVEGLTGMSILAAQGFGKGWHSKDADTHSIGSQTPWVKLEIACREELVMEVVKTIETTAHTGLKGDGKIYVSDIEQAVRISTGERGDGTV